MPLIGITGTNGKTTTAYLIHSALVALGRQVGLIGTVETRIGDERVRSVRTTPRRPTCTRCSPRWHNVGMDACVMEVSSHALSQHRVDGVIYDPGALHQPLPGSPRLPPRHGGLLRGEGLALHACTIAVRRSASTTTGACDWPGRARSRSTPLTTQPGDWPMDRDHRPHDPHRFVLRGRGDELHLVSALPGAFNVTNTAMAAAAVLLLGSGQRGGSTRSPGGPARAGTHGAGGARRRSGRPAGGCRGLRAHTGRDPSRLEALRPVTAGTLVCVTGAGGDRDRDKRAAMGRAAALADVVIVTDDNPRSEDPGSIRRPSCAVGRDRRRDCSRGG